MRRDIGRTISKMVNGNCIDIDYKYILLYNPFLLKYIETHINVKICASVHSIKYLHKYGYKGYNCDNFQVTADQNSVNYCEVSTYFNIRYVGSYEIAYRIFAYNMHEKAHTVVRLAVCLPDEQQVYFTNDNTLIGRFNLNIYKETKSPFCYLEIPKYYIWNKKKRN
jgi:hypothetical protein